MSQPEHPTNADGSGDRYPSIASRIDLWTVGLGVLSAILALLIVLPMFWLLWRAAEVHPSRAFDLMFSVTTAKITLNSLILMGAVTLFSILLGVPMALLTTRTDLPYPRVWTVIAALPLVIPSYIGAIAFVSMFGSGGEIDTLFGMTIPRVHGLWGAVFIITLYTYPYVFLTTRAALLSMDTSLVDAARTLNHGSFKAFWNVTLPVIRPGIAAGALLAALYAISDFGTPAFMQASVFTNRIFLEFHDFAVEYAALLALQLISIVAVILVIEAGIGQDTAASGSGGSGRGRTIQLGWWKWPAMGAFATIGVLTLIVPVAIFMNWFIYGAGDRIPYLEFQLDVAGNSVYLAVLASLVALLFALPIAYFSGRTNRLVARIFERMTYIGFAIPGVVIGLALVFLGTRTLPSLYRQGVWLLVFGYVVRFLPQAVGTIRSSVLQLDDATLEAARTLNASRFETFRRVTLPMIAPGMVAGAVLVFLTTMKELPITLMIQPIGMDTLVIKVWQAHQALAYRYAAIPAILLIVISGLTLLVLLRQEDYNMA